MLRGFGRRGERRTGESALALRRRIRIGLGSGSVGLLNNQIKPSTLPKAKTANKSIQGNSRRSGWVLFMRFMLLVYFSSTRRRE